MYSMLIRGGFVVDGSDAPAFKADIALKNETIVAIKPDICGEAERVIDAEGLVVAPGFIDIHSHTDGTIFNNPLSDSKVLQGVTTEATGNCGIGCFPVDPGRSELLLKYLELHGFTLPEEKLPWRNFTDYAVWIENRGIGVNLAPLVGHGALRIAAMGSDDRTPTEQEQQAMEVLLQQLLEEGAWGLSTGLIYPPGSFADFNELKALGDVLSRQEAVFTSHIRNESNYLLSAVDEIIEIGRASGARVQISHLKAIGPANWGKGRQALERIEAAQRDGVNIGADQYPYEASSTSLTALVPSWAHSGGVDALLARLVSRELHNQIRDAIQEEMTTRGGPERVMIASVPSQANRCCIGKTVADIAKMWNCSAAEVVMRLLREENAVVQAVYFSISPEDIAAIMSSKLVAVASDGRGMNADLDFVEASHPRSYGTFPRVLARYMREKGLLSLETAVYKMTGLPAQRLGMIDRGLLKPGLVADITIFDQKTICDQADFYNPHRYPVGIQYVLVNGCVTAINGELTGNKSGKVLRKNK